MDELMPRVTVHLAAAEGDAADDVWSLVSWAIAHRERLACRYEAVHGDEDAGEARFVLDPYELYFGQRAWYVIGRRDDRDAPRTLRLSRFLDVQRTRQRFDVPEDFSLTQHFGQAWRMIPGDRRGHRVVLRFNPEVADTVSETVWHPTQQEQLHDDGSVSLRFEIDGLDEITWWVLGYGPHCAVQEPAELRQKVAELPQATARRYIEFPEET
jgi:predicted DNA-binding transcriptional regulator YafY